MPSFGGNPGNRALPPPPAPSRSAGAPPSHTDVTSGGGYGGAQATAFKQTPAYRQAVVSVFHAQPPAQQHAIVQAARQTPTPEGRMILAHIGGADPFSQTINRLGSQGAIKGSVFGPGSRAGIKTDPTQKPPGDGGLLGTIGGALSDVGHLLTSYGPASTSSKGERGTGALGTIFGGATQNPAKTLANAGSDLINLPNNTVQGLAGIGQQIGQGHFGNAVGMLVDPYVKFFTDPTTMLHEHPLNTAMLFGGPETALGRGVGAIARSGVLGKTVKGAASTARAPLELGPGTGIFEHRSYSPNLVTKGVQVAREQAQKARGRNPNVSRPASPLIPDAVARTFTIGADAKMARIANEMTGVQQMGQREGRSAGVAAINTHRPSKPVQDLVSFINQRVVRTPGTAIEDITKEINRLKAAQTGKRSFGEIQNRRQVKSLSQALKNPGLLHEAFTAAQPISDWFNTRDAYLASHALIDPEQAMRSKVVPYAMAHMGVTYDHKLGEFVDHAGKPLATQTILDHLKANGVPDPSYVGHYPGRLGAGNFYMAYKGARGSKAGAPRTGAAFKGGAYDHSFDALAAQAAKTEQVMSRAGLHDAIINRLGIAKPTSMRGPGENGMYTPAEAKAAAYAYQHDDHGNPLPGRPELVPITAAPVKNAHAISNVQHPSELIHVDQLEHDAMQHAISDAAGRKDQTRNVVLVPKAAMDAFAKQYKSTPEFFQKIGQVTQQFRRTVLPYSTHWMTQIATEAGLRGAVAGVIDPRNIVAGRQLMSELKQRGEAGKNVARETVNATFYNANDPLARVNPNPGPFTKAVKAAPVTKQIIQAHNSYANHIGATMYHLEHQFRVMGLGKLARKDIQEFSGKYQAAVKVQGQLMADLANRLTTDPAKVAQFGRQIDDIFGKYNKFGPTTRAAVQTVAPFLPWYLNAAKFVFWNLPVKHPVASSLLASLRQTINQDKQDGKKMPLDPYQVAALARLTPFGIAGRTPADTITSPILPEISGAMNVLKGNNVFGDRALKGPHGKVTNAAQKEWLAANSVAESLFPGLRLARTALEGGSSPYDTSTIVNPQTRPNTKTSILDRLFNPFKSLRGGGTAAFQKQGGGGRAGDWLSHFTDGSGGYQVPGSGGGGDWIKQFGG